MYLAEALRHPMDRFPAGAYTKDDEDWGIVGATMTPWCNLDDLSKFVPDARIVVYVRTNIVKHAIASVHAFKIKHNGGGFRNEKNTSKQIVVNVTELEYNLVSVMVTDKVIFDTALSLTKYLERQYFFYLSYEELVGDLNHIDRLLQWSGVNPEDFSWKPESARKNCGRCTKVTSDDLRNVLVNYEEVHNWIKSNYPCLLPQFYETRPDINQPDIKLSCG